MTHDCSICGEPTTSQYEMCQRPGPCSRAYRAKWNREQPKEHRNEVVRRWRRGRQKGVPSVYAIWFPDPQVLKVGFTVNTSDAIFVGTARQGAKHRGWKVEGSSCIWKRPGDVRVEAWIQATLAFRWLGAYGKRQNRICEWFQVPGLLEEEITGILDGVYGLVPTDLSEAAK